jgi:hypothetical protein
VDTERAKGGHTVSGSDMENGTCGYRGQERRGVVVCAHLLPS